jgi:hypothetical protein
MKRLLAVAICIIWAGTAWGWTSASKQLIINVTIRPRAKLTLDARKPLIRSADLYRAREIIIIKVHTNTGSSSVSLKESYEVYEVEDTQTQRVSFRPASRNEQSPDVVYVYTLCIP